MERSGEGVHAHGEAPGGEVQTFGARFELCPEMVIVRASADACAAGVLGRPLAEALGPALAEAAQAAAPTLMPGSAADLGPAPGEPDRRATLYPAAHGWVVELLPATAPFDAGAALQLLHDVSVMASTHAEIEALCGLVTRALRGLTGHDRVFVARLGSRASGRWFVEARAPGLEPLSISRLEPAAARGPPLDRVRAIADVDAAPGRLLADRRAAEGEATVGLLRAPTAAERAWLREVGGRASLSATIVRGGREWGVLECLHGEPRAPTAAERALVAALAHALGRVDDPGLARPGAHDIVAASVGEAVLLFDPAGVVTHWNDAATRILGWTAAETLGRPALELFAEAERAALLSRFAGIEEGPVEVELDVSGRDGAPRRLQARVQRYFAADGALLGLCGTFRDLTEHRRAELALRESEARFGALADAAPVLIWVADAVGRRTFVNQAWLSFTGRARADELGEGWLAGVHPEDRGGCLARARQAMARGDRFEQEYRLRGRDGAYRWIFESASPRCYGAGVLHGYVGSCVDITERRRVETESRVWAQRLALALDCGKLGVWEQDMETRQVVWDARCAELFGMTLAEFDRTYAGAVRRIHLYDLPPLEAKLRRAFQGREEFDYEFRVIMPAGEVHWLSGRGHVLRDASGAPVRAIGVVQDVTTRRAVEEALRTSNRLYELLTAAMQDVVALITRRGRLAYVSPSVKALLGYDAEELEVEAELGMIAPQDRDAALRAAEDALEGQAARVECRLRHRAGHWVTIESIMTPLRDDSGRSTGVVVCVRDISLRRHAQEALGEAHRRFAELVATVDGIVWEADAGASQFRFVSRAAERMLGYPLARWLEPGFWHDHLHPEDRAATASYWTESPPQGENYRLEYRMIAEDGRVVWLQDTVTVVHGERGQRLLRGIMVDVTERRRIEASERALNERFELAAGSAGIGVWDLSIVRGTLVLDDRMLAIYHMDRAGLRGTLSDWQQRVHPDDLQAVVLAKARAIQERGVADVEYRIVLPSGELRHIRSFGKVVADARGRPVRLTGINIDISERKRSEELQRQMEQRLRQSHKLEAIGQLAGGVAHDFNNLLMVITLSAHQLLERVQGGTAEHESLESLEAIREAGERGAALTRQLLAFGRKQVLTVTMVDLNAVIGQLGKMLARLLGEDIESGIHLAPGLRTIRADVTQLDQILINLAVNARDAMPCGGRLEIETSPLELTEPSTAFPEATAGAYVALTVRDTGCGMDEATRARIFEPFFTTKEPGKGTGLGLATVYGIVKQFAGHIAVESAPGRGTTFTIAFPAIGPAGRGDAGAAGASRAGGTEALLIVEDDANVRRITTRLLERRGYRVLAARDGAEALRICERVGGAIDLLLTDVVMPGMGGTQVAEALRARIPGLRVVFMSGYNDDMVLRHGIEQQKVPFLQKPFTADALERIVRAALTGG